MQEEEGSRECSPIPINLFKTDEVASVIPRIGDRTTDLQQRPLALLLARPILLRNKILVQHRPDLRYLEHSHPVLAQAISFCFQRTTLPGIRQTSPPQNSTAKPAI